MRLIDADALRTVRSIQRADFNRIETIQKWIDEAPTIEPVRRGRWEAIDWANEYFKCSGCGRIERWSPNYCPRCGLKMAKRTRYVGTSNIIEEPNCRAKMDGGEEE